MTLWLFLSATYQPRATHFAGGDHVLACMAATLGGRSGGGGGGGSGGGGGGSEAHLLYATTRGAVLAAAAQVHAASENAVTGAAQALEPGASASNLPCCRSHCSALHHALLPAASWGFLSRAPPPCRRCPEITRSCCPRPGAPRPSNSRRAATSIS
jgi:hypothetical protein